MNFVPTANLGDGLGDGAMESETMKKIYELEKRVEELEYRLNALIDFIFKKKS